LTAELLAWRVGLPLAKRAFTVQAIARIMWARAHPAAVSDVAGFLGQGGRWLVSRNCLERSLVLYRLLSRAGANPALVLGVRPGPERVAGHVWIEIGGRPVAETEALSYDRVIVLGTGGRPVDIAAR
jgi:hypothetical protein